MISEAMSKLEFLLGEWDLEYRIPRSFFSEAGSDSGTGTFKRALDGRYVFFDYSTKTGGEAHAILAWDEKANIYRYWWFENSGAFLTATCNLIGDGILALNWHDTLFVQTFERDQSGKIILKMQHPAAKGGYELILEVVFTRK
jgi:hypothetical protein